MIYGVSGRLLSGIESVCLIVKRVRANGVENEWFNLNNGMDVVLTNVDLILKLR